MELRDGNVFSRVFLFMEGGAHVTITHDILDLTLQGLLSPYRTPALSPPPVQGSALTVDI